MEKYIEFQDTEVPDINPNSTNDIYKEYGSVSIDIFFIVLAIMLFAFLILSRAGVLPFTGKQERAILFMVFFMSVFAGIFLYGKYFKRKKIIKNGVSYTGVIIDCNEYETDAYGPDCKYVMYAITVKYKDGKKVISGFDTNPQKYLENPYCTLYRGRREIIAADFKVRSEYLTKKGTFKYKKDKYSF